MYGPSGEPTLRSDTSGLKGDLLSGWSHAAGDTQFVRFECHLLAILESKAQVTFSAVLPSHPLSRLPISLVKLPGAPCKMIQSALKSFNILPAPPCGANTHRLLLPLGTSSGHSDLEAFHSRSLERSTAECLIHLGVLPLCTSLAYTQALRKC